LRKIASEFTGEGESVKMTIAVESRVESSRAVRRLGFGEVRMHLMHAMFSGSTQGAAILHLRGPIQPDALRRAAMRLMQEHEILNARIERLGDAFWFCRRELPVRAPVTVLHREDADSWLRVLERENSGPLDTGSELWRVFLLLSPPERQQEHELILLAHHAIIDGAATGVMFERLLTATAGLSEDAEQRPARPIAPPAEDFWGFSLSWQDYERRQAAMGDTRRGVEPLPYSENAPLSSRMTCVLPLTPSAEASRKLLELSREARISVNSYLSALFLQALGAALPERDRLILHTAVSLRELTGGKIRSEDLGCYLAVISTMHDVRSEAAGALGTLAMEHQIALRNAALNEARNPNEVDLARFEAAMRPLAGAERFSLDFGITFVDAPLPRSYGPLEVTAFYGSANRAIGSAAAVLQVIQLGERLFFTLNYTKPLQRREWVERVAKELMQRVEALSAQRTS
jgi:hypothetical protein